MSGPTPPAFGKRNAPRAPARAAVVPPVGIDPDAFFAEVRRELEPADARPLVVANSLLSAVLAGIVVGCALIGLDVTGMTVTGMTDTYRPLADVLPGHPQAAAVVPLMILLGLIGGGRAAATSLLVAHSMLRRMNLTGHVAYVVGGAAAATGFAGLMVLVSGQAPTHGWLIDGLAGGAGGFFYRVFAGARRA